MIFILKVVLLIGATPVMFSIGGYAVAQVIAVYQTWMPTLGSSINSEPIYKRLSKWVSEDFELMRLST